MTAEATGTFAIAIRGAEAGADATIVLQADIGLAEVSIRPASAGEAPHDALAVTIPAMSFDALRSAIARLGDHSFAMTPALLRIAPALVERDEDVLEAIHRSVRAAEFASQFITTLLADQFRRRTRSTRLSADDTSRIAIAMDLINERWREGMSIEGLARACGLNRDKLARGFRSLFSCSIGDAIAERRLGHAEELLATTDIAIATVAYRSGYLNDASFCRAFRRRFGMSPGMYRERKMAA